MGSTPLFHHHVNTVHHDLTNAVRYPHSIDSNKTQRTEYSVIFYGLMMVAMEGSYGRRANSPAHR
jgi:hypothetical protein